MPLVDGPLSPWLRLAHIWQVKGLWPAFGLVRRLRDHQLILQLAGDSWIWSKDLDGSVALPPGSVAFLPPGLIHAWGETPGGTRLAVHFDLIAQPRLEPMAMLDMLGRRIVPAPATRGLRFRLGHGDNALVLPLVTALRDPAVWRERLEHLVGMYGSRQHRTLANRLHAAEILTWCLRTLVADAAAVTPQRITPARERVAQLLAEVAVSWSRRRPSMATLARRAGLGESAFRAAVMALTGCTPRTHFEAATMARAAHRLVESDDSIAAIATVAGYEDAFHFSRVFRRVMGHSPRAYRQARR